MLQYIKLCSFLSALHIFYEILHGRNRQRLIMKSLFKCSRSIRFVLYTDYNFWLAYFGCADMFPQLDSINTNSLDYLEITHPVYQHQPLKWAYSTKYMRTMTLSPKYNISANDDVMTWERYPHYWPFVKWIIRWLPVGCTHKVPVMRRFTLVFIVSLNKLINRNIKNVCTVHTLHSEAFYSIQNPRISSSNLLQL